MRKRILEQPIDIITMEEASYIAKAALVNPKQLKIITLNPEMVVNASNNFEFQAAINNSNLIVPDGTGILWALRLLNPGSYDDATRVPGIELAERILVSVNELKKKIAIFGGTKEILTKAIEAINQNHPNIEIVKAIDGYQGKENDSEIAKEIANEKPNLILVALGSPRQEIWINKNSFLFPQSIMIGIGGSLDIWSGKANRAPKWFRDNHLEWFYRAITQPKRTIRILKTLPAFVWMVIKEKMKNPE